MTDEAARSMNTLPFHTESPVATTEPVTSVGAFRALRTAKGYSVEDVAARLKFTVKQIQSLEAEEFERLPRGIALKGLVKNYAKLLGIDSKEIEASLSPFIGSVSGGISQHTSTRTLGTHDLNHSSAGGTAIWIILILVVLLAAASIAVWQGIIPPSWVPGWLGAIFK